MARIIEVLFTTDQRWEIFLYGYLNTVLISLGAVVLGIILGILLAVCKVLPRDRIIVKILNKAADVYITVIRGTPVLVQLMIFYFAVFPAGTPEIIVAIIGFGINSSAYVAEIIRSGIMSLDPGQMEAGRSLGLSYPATMIKIVLPQAVKNILPALGNELIVLVKETSVASVVTITELTEAARRVSSDSYEAFIPYFFVAIVYLLTVLILTYFLTKLEKRLRKSERKAV